MQREPFLGSRACYVHIAGVDRHGGGAVECFRARERRLSPVPERRLEPNAALAEVSSQVPEPPERADETQDAFVVLRRLQEGDGRADVVVLELEPIEERAVAGRQLRLGGLRQREKEVGMARSGFPLGGREKLFRRVLTDRLEHRQSRLWLRRRELYEVLLLERGDARDHVAVGAADGVRGL